MKFLMAIVVVIVWFVQVPNDMDASFLINAVCQKP
jgi:hypothetical protein